jgi:hypothetical protein
MFDGNCHCTPRKRADGKEDILLASVGDIVGTLPQNRKVWPEAWKTKW